MNDVAVPRVIDEHAFDVQVGARIRAARKAAGWSQEQLCAVLSTSQAAMSLYESGARKLTMPKLLMLAQALNRPLDYFLGEEVGALHATGDSTATVLTELEARPEFAPEVLQYIDFLKVRSGDVVEPLPTEPSHELTELPDGRWRAVVCCARCGSTRGWTGSLKACESLIAGNEQHFVECRGAVAEEVVP